MIQSGDLIAFSHEGWGSWSDIESQIVRMLTRSEYSHVGIVAPEMSGRCMLFEAVIPKVRVFPLSKLLPFYWIQIGSPLNQEAEEFAFSRVGEEYSKLEAIRGYFNSTKDDRFWQCAEYSRGILGFNKSLPVGIKATPTSLVKGCLSAGHSLILVK